MGVEGRVLWAEFIVASVSVRAVLVDMSTEPLAIAYKAQHDEWPIGYFDVVTSTILVDRSLSIDLAEAVLVHELGHVQIKAFGITLVPGKTHTEEQEESVVNALCAAQYDTFKRNGLLRLPAHPFAAPGA